jgi:aryl-alcohol dehydrogenase-like predicted oxidoreductase
MRRRTLLATGLGLTSACVVATRLVACSRSEEDVATAEAEPDASSVPGQMRYRNFGSTGLKVSEVGFGAWGIGGNGYGSVQRSEALDALARAEELGCNFVDSALVYGDSETLLGEFLEGRRQRWIVATKYSGQQEGLAATIEKQLKLLRTDVIDYYQLHWVPRGQDEKLLDELADLKRKGKARFIGVSLYTPQDIDFVTKFDDMDGFQVAFNLLEPDPFLARLQTIHRAGKAVIVRSALREGFLTGKYRRDATFPDPKDQRHKWTAQQIAETVDRVERFRFLEHEAGSMVVAAARYPLSFPDVSTVLLGTKSVTQAASNFGEVPGGKLSAAALARVRDTQIDLGLGSAFQRILRRFRLAP